MSEYDDTQQTVRDQGDGGDDTVGYPGPRHCHREQSNAGQLDMVCLSP